MKIEELSTVTFLAIIELLRIFEELCPNSVSFTFFKVMSWFDICASLPFTFLTVIPIIEKLELAVILISEKLLFVPSSIAALICAESLSKTYCDAIVIEVLDGMVKSSS